MDELSISKRIPARVKKLTARWCRLDYTEMSDTYRKIRHRDPCKCFWCGHKFQNGEMMALAAFNGKRRNQTLCQDCGKQLLTPDARGA